MELQTGEGRFETPEIVFLVWILRGNACWPAQFFTAQWEIGEPEEQICLRVIRAPVRQEIYQI